MKIRKSEKIIMSIMIIVLLIVIIMGISYAAFVHSYAQEEANNFTAACYDIDYDEEVEGITVENSYPMSDVRGLMQKPYKLTMTNNCKTTIGYNVMLNILKDSTTPIELMKVSVNDTVKYVTKLPKGESSIADKKEAYKLLTGNLNSQESITYEFRAWMNIDSTTGQNTNFSNKISVEVSPYPLLAGAILLNSNFQVVEPDFSVAYPKPSAPNETSLSGLYATEDDDGISYYYRGAVDNNYVSFAGKNWKIIRINGDGTIRIMLIDISDKTYGYGYNWRADDGTSFTRENQEPCTASNPCVTNFENGNFINVGNFTNNVLKNGVEQWYKDNLTAFDNKIAMGRFCSDTSYYTGDEEQVSGSKELYFMPQARINGTVCPTLTCPDPVDANGNFRKYGGSYLTKVGLITTDELRFAGRRTTAGNNAETNFLYGLETWTMTPRGWGYNPNANPPTTYGTAWFNATTAISYTDTSWWKKILPVINLRADTTFTTESEENPGTVDNPYIVK